MTTENILGYELVTSDLNSLLEDIVQHVKNKSHFKYLACFNPHSYAIAKNDTSFKEALYSASWLVPDGIGVVYASRFNNGRIKHRITGFDVFFGICTELNKAKGFKIFFLGSSEDILARIKVKCEKEFPQVCVVGIHSPPFKLKFSDKDTELMIQKINDMKPDVLWVGMTSPKQDMWIFENRHRIEASFAAGIGAVFDFYCGNVKRSHPIFQKLGLEWLPRLLRQPKRLWRRMLVSAPVFVWDVIKKNIKL